MSKPAFLLIALALSSAAIAAPNRVEVPLAVPAPASATAPAIPATPAALDPAQLRELRSRYAAWQAMSEGERARVPCKGNAPICARGMDSPLTGAGGSAR